jgi:nicotinamide-nucleotide amidase
MIINGFFQKSLKHKAQIIFENCLQKKLKIAFGESCTGGLLSVLFTEIHGSSQVVECGLVTYSNQAKIDFLGVSKKTLERFGAVSKEVAQEMANGLLKNCHVELAVSVTGIAGPDGGSNEKPVGKVFIAFSSFEKNVIKEFLFVGDRSQVRFQAVAKALEIIEENL